MCGFLSNQSLVCFSDIPDSQTDMRCHTVTRYLRLLSTVTESNGLSISKCDFNNTDVESASSDYETDTTNKKVCNLDVRKD